MRAERIAAAILLLMLAAAPGAAQEAQYGLTMPFTATTGVMHTGRTQSSEPWAGTLSAGFRATLYPGVKLGEHWFAYAALQLNSTPFFPYEAYSSEHEMRARVVQAFAGYSRSWGRTSVVIKAGHLSSAFGSFPLRYDDAANPLVDQPLPYSYASYYLYPDYLPYDPSRPKAYSAKKSARSATTNAAPAGGTTAASYRPGIVPVTLYGLPGVQIDFARSRVDARLQVTNSSPANPQTWWSGTRRAQWAAGAGYSVVQGFRVGVSGFRGPFLEKAVEPSLPSGRTVADFPASGLGVDVQWARGRWSANAEWQRFHFDYPYYDRKPSMTFAYGEVKSVLTPRLFVAARAGFRFSPDVLHAGAPLYKLDKNISSYEAGVGYHVNPRQLLKVSYQWFRAEGDQVSRNNVFAVQLVTSVRSLSRALR